MHDRDNWGGSALAGVSCHEEMRLCMPSIDTIFDEAFLISREHAASGQRFKHGRGPCATNAVTSASIAATAFKCTRHHHTANISSSSSSDNNISTTTCLCWLPYSTFVFSKSAFILTLRLSSASSCVPPISNQATVRGEYERGCRL